MQPDPWVLGQPVPDGGVLVGAVVVQHHMQVSAWIGPSDELEEGQELGVSMPVKPAAGDLAGGDLQGGEQASDAVPDIVMGAPLGQPRAQRQGWRGAVQRLDLGLLVHTEHDRAGGRFQSGRIGRSRMRRRLRDGRRWRSPV